MSLFFSLGPISLIRFNSNHIFTDGPQLLLVFLDEGDRGRGLPGAVTVVHPALTLDGVVQGAVESCLVSISSTFYEQLLCPHFCTKKLQSKTVTREKLCEALSYEKVWG